MRMNTVLHRALARAGGEAVRQPLSAPYDLDEGEPVLGGCGVYIACNHHDEVLYVGSVHRPYDPAGISRRLREHLREPTKAMHWSRAWVLVADGKDLRWVRQYEGLVGDELEPSWNDRLPKF